MPPNLPKLVLGGLIALIILTAVFSTFFTVETESQAVVMRFGKVIDTVEPGLHFKLPFGIDRHRAVKVRRQMKQEFGFGTPGATDPWQFSERSEWPEEKNMVTGDLNAALVEWVVQYRIEEPKQYLFEVRNPDSTLRVVSESVMRQVVGDRTVDEVITIGRQQIEEEALQEMQKVVREYSMGIRIDQVQLKGVNPPERVQASFNEVNQAQQEKERAINVANGEYNKVIPRARGEADQKIQAAEGYAQKRINEAMGDAAAFNAVLAEYVKAPEVTRRRLYLETMQEVVPRIGQTIILDDETKNLLPLLNLGARGTENAQ